VDFLQGGWGGVFVKLVLEIIPSHWVSLYFILKGVLEKVIRVSFEFLWAGDYNRMNFHGYLLRRLWS
jgi:hypothetical protein